MVSSDGIFHVLTLYVLWVYFITLSSGTTIGLCTMLPSSVLSQVSHQYLPRNIYMFDVIKMILKDKICILNECHYSIQHTYTSNTLRTSILVLVLYFTHMIVIFNSLLYHT